jgi:inorganic pyrophosphatase
VLELDQEEKSGGRVRNDRILAVPLSHSRGDDVKTYVDLDPRVLDELAHFFTSAVFFAGKDPRIIGWNGPEAALRLIRESARRAAR